MSTNFLLLLYFVQALVYGFNKSITLNNTHQNGSGIAVQITETNVNTTNNVWHIDPSTQTGTDLEISMDNEWGFHPDIESTISFRIDGYTPNITKADGEFFILFGVNNTQYFSVLIRLDQGETWASYPSWQFQPLATSDNIKINLISPAFPKRYDRVSNNLAGNYGTVPDTTCTENRSVGENPNLRRLPSESERVPEENTDLI